jgi:hypothetical protein
MNDDLIKLIQSSDYLQKIDKDYLIAILPQLEKLEVLRLKQNLAAKKAPVLLKQLDSIRQRYQQSQNKKANPDPISKLVERFVPKKEKVPLSYSIFSKPDYLGSPTPKAVATQVQPIKQLMDIKDPAQLKLLSPQLLDTLNQEGFEQKYNQFVGHLSSLFSRIDDIPTRRNYFLNYMQSSLFTAYLSTGLTAMKHEELKPRKISLNLLYQIDQKYLNSRQFKTVAMLTNHLKALCVL